MYSHTQRSPLYLLLHAISALTFAIAWFLRGDQTMLTVLLLSALVTFILGLAFKTLTITDETYSLLVQFGPIPLFWKRIDYTELTAARLGRTKFLDGWGIHWVPRRGWTYNLWGFECVELTVAGSTIRLGTDDAEHLARFLKTKIGFEMESRDDKQLEPQVGDHGGLRRDH